MFAQNTQPQSATNDTAQEKTEQTAKQEIKSAQQQKAQISQAKGSQAKDSQAQSLQSRNQSPKKLAKTKLAKKKTKKKKLDPKFLSSNPLWILNYEKEVLFLSEDLQYLPLSSSVWHSLEKLWLPAVLYGAHTGGFNDTDPVIINSHGSSYVWQKYYLGLNDITSANSPGQPLIDISYYGLDAFGVNAHNGSYAQREGYRYVLKEPFSGSQKNGKDNNADDNNTNTKTETKHSFVHLSLPTSVGGASFVVPHTLDREPATDWRAPQQTRFYYPSVFVAGGREYRLKNNRKGMLYVDARVDNRKFIKVDKLDSSFRASMYYSLYLKPQQKINVMYQGQYQPFSDARWGLAKAQTMATHNHVFLVQHSLKQANARHDSMFSYQVSSARINAEQWSRSLADEIQYGKADAPVDKHGFVLDHVSRFENFYFFKKTPQVKMNFVVPVNFSFRVDDYHIPNSVFTQSYSGSGLTVTLFDKNKPAFSFLLVTRPGFEISHKGNIFDYQFNGGLTVETSGDQNSMHFVRIEPYASFRSTLHFKKGRWRLHGSLSHEPIPFTLRESAFLNDRTLSGKTHLWDDQNHDGIYQAGEEENVITNTGGAYHKSKGFLLGPSVQQLNLSVEKPLPKNWALAFAAMGKIENNLLTVVNAGGFDSGYQLIDHGGSPTGQVYERNGLYGQESFVLTNSEKPSYFASIEIQVLKQKISNRLALQFSVGTYLHLVRTTLGNYPLGNDVGVYSEISANPNSSFNTLARSAYDRGYIIKFQYLWQISKHLFFSGIIHYRDGIPLTTIKVVQGLNQGVAQVMKSERGGGLEGVGRYSFFMDVDFRLMVKFTNWNFFFDIYNFFHLRLELDEQLLHNQSFRDPLEMIPPRMFRFGANFKL